jgi:hypothetical protein
MTLEMDLPHVYTEQGIPINVRAVAQVKVNGTDESIRRAAVSRPEEAPEAGRASVADPNQANRRRRITALAPGWRRRRLFAELLREGELDTLDEAVELAALSGSDSQVTWALGDILEEWTLSPDDLDRLPAAVPSSSARRRLAGRYERGNT